ncbi:MAG: EAL domain-containing protein [Granulosicoccus sp.]
MQHDGLTLSANNVATLFPFHILISDKDAQVLSLGAGIVELLGTECTGTAFEDLFEVTRPRLAELTVTTVNAHSRSSVFLRITHRDMNVMLRGQLLATSANTVLFIGTPQVKNGLTLEQHDINLKLFQPYDLTPDLVILHKFRELELRDSQKNAKTLYEVSRSRDELHEFANTDALTNVTNRRGFWLGGENILEEHNRNPSSTLLLAVLDLVQFKAINDHFGHKAGDAILCELADRLLQFIGTRGLVGRLGGDEFVVLYKLDADRDCVECIQSALNLINKPFIHENQKLPLNASIGVTTIKTNDTLESAIHDADIAMYEGRFTSTAGIHWYTPELAKRIEEKSDLLERLKRAIDSELIEPHFQPIIELSNNKLIGFEALARWNDAKDGMILPDIFIALAEELGILATLDRQILGKTLDQLHSWRESGENYSVHVNVSAASIDPSLVAYVSSALSIRKLDPACLILELTETTILEKTDLTKEVIEGLQSLGVKVQLDDFGTGYSSLSHIRDFPVSGIKIDRSFVADAHVNDRAKALLKSVVNIAQELNLDIVAEGIDNQLQMKFLANIGCQCGQGFYIGKPSRPSSCEQLFPESQKRAA